VPYSSAKVTVFPIPSGVKIQENHPKQPGQAAHEIVLLKQWLTRYLSQVRTSGKAILRVFSKGNLKAGHVECEAMFAQFQQSV